MPASMIVGHGEAKVMATKQKATRAITKKALAYLLSRLCGRCDSPLAQFLADLLGIALTV